MKPPAAFRFQDTVASVLLDVVRGLAALAVCCGHWRTIFFVDYPALTGARVLWLPAYALTRLGYQAVIIFFVLSGYLVGGHILRALAHDTWSWREYLWHRGVRLYLVLIPALLLGGLLDWIGLHSHLAPGLYTGLLRDHYDVRSTLTWQAFWGCLFFLQTLRTSFLGTNGALWSLAFEAWYYIIFPLGLLCCIRSRSWRYRLICGGLCLLACWFVGAGMLRLLPIWLAGVWLTRWQLRPTSTWQRMVATALYLALVLAASRSGSHIFLWSYLQAAGTLAYLWVLLGGRCSAAGLWYTLPSRTLAGFSYTLYLVHLPILMLCAAVLIGDTRWYPTAAHVAGGAGVLLLCLALAYCMARVTEFRTAAVRAALERAFARPGGGTPRRTR